MAQSSDKSGDKSSARGESNKPTERELSQRQALENADAARNTRRSGIPGVADDSEVIQESVAALAAPVEGAADAMREDERARVRSKSPDAKADNVTGPRPTDTPNVTSGRQRRAQPPARAEDAEWDPLAATAEHRSSDDKE